MKVVLGRVVAVSTFVCGLGVGFVGCGSDAAPTTPTPPPPSFSVQANSANEFGFYSVFGADTRDFQLSAQRSDSGSLASGGWSSSDPAKVQLTPGAAAGSATGKAISAGDPTVTFQVEGVTGTTVVKSRPNLFRIRGTYQVTTCTDTLAPAVAPSLCAGSIANSLAIGQTGNFYFDLSTNLNNAQVSGRFYDTRIGGSIFHQINPPVTISSSGEVSFEGVVVANVGIGSGVSAYNNVTVRQVWTVTAAKVDDVIGRSTLTITINSRRGNVTVEREIRSVRDGR